MYDTICDVISSANVITAALLALWVLKNKSHIPNSYLLYSIITLMYSIWTYAYYAKTGFEDSEILVSLLFTLGVTIGIAYNSYRSNNRPIVYIDRRRNRREKK